MINLSSAKNIVLRSIGRGGLILRKYSPEILLGVGVVGVVASTVMACKATLKIDEVLKKTQDDIDRIERQKLADSDIYSAEDADSDLAIVYTRRIMKLVELYGPAVALGAASIACIIGAHNILSKRNVALMAAYKIVSESFKKYQERVAAELGEEKAKSFRLDTLPNNIVNVTTIGEDGKVTTKEKVVSKFNPKMGSEYARFFDERSTRWQRNYEYNMFFLKSQQNYANELLTIRGHIFLNEVYDLLGLERTKAGSVVGWVKNSKGDNFVDFDIYNAENGPGGHYESGVNRSFLLDFNVDGIIYDLI